MTGLNCQRVTHPCSFKRNLNILQQLWWKDCSLCLEGIHLIKDFEDTWLLILICHDISFYWAFSRNIVQRSQTTITHQTNSKRSRKDMNWPGLTLKKSKPIQFPVRVEAKKLWYKPFMKDDSSNSAHSSSNRNRNNAGRFAPIAHLGKRQISGSICHQTVKNLAILFKTHFPNGVFYL